MLKNAKGIYCYRLIAGNKWNMGANFQPDKSTGVAYIYIDHYYCPSGSDSGSDSGSEDIVAKGGPLPVGARTWKIADRSIGMFDHEFADGTLTVGLLVRAPLPSPAACASLPSADRCSATLIFISCAFLK